jgi:hypothetical protein
MGKLNSHHIATIQRILAQLRPSTQELAAVKRLEEPGKEDQFAVAIRKLDKKYDHVVLQKAPGLDQKAMKPAPLPAIHVPAFDPYEYPKAKGGIPFAGPQMGSPPGSSYVFPFTFRSLNISGSITGPETSEVRGGMLGAGRLNDEDYTLTNLGDTDGTTRVPLRGDLLIVFRGQIREKGTYALMLPTGNLMVFGSTRVIGHGNSSTCYDSKASVNVAHFLIAGEECIETTCWDIHSDRTPSEDRTKEFGAWIPYETRYVRFNAVAAMDVNMYIILSAYTEANEDGKAWVNVRHLGFPAVNTTDYDTMITRIT